MSDAIPTPVVSGGETSATAEVNNAPVTSKPEVEKHKIKISGQEREYSIDDLKRLASLAEGSNEKFRKASEIEKQHKEWQTKYKANPYKALIEIGLTPQEARAKLEDDLVEQMKYDQLSPEQKRLMELEAKEQEREAQDAKRKEEETTKQQQIEKDRAIGELDHEFAQAYEKANLPKDPLLASMAVQIMKSAIANDQDLSAEEAVGMVKNQMPKLVRSLVKNMTPDQKKEFFGKEFLNEIREADVAAIKKAEAPFTKPSAVKQAQPAVPNTQAAEAPKQKSGDFFASIRGLKK